MNTTCNIDSFLLPINKAVSVGLIVNEIITNSIKYAEVSGVEKNIYINALINQGNIELDIYDDGVTRKSSDVEMNSLGTLIIQDLTKQLKATLEVNENFRYKIAIPIR
jgi:two-component sensor histidine kinase